VAEPFLFQIQTAIDERTDAIRQAAVASGADWPCRKGCDDCCRSLASEPLISEAEWRMLEPALTPALKQNIAASAKASRPVTCPLLDLETGACRVYQVRPLACRTYGYYAERDKVLGCHRIEAVAASDPFVLWGNHAALEARTLAELGPVQALSDWLNA
jgi:Fe-S-cluster containining protein